MADYDNITSTQNTLWNSDESGQIAYSEQIKDAKISWTSNDKKYNGSYPDPEDPTKSIPYIPDYDPEHPDVFSKTEDNKFQSKLNEFFLNHWADWQHFLHEQDLDPHTINTWRELEEFLKGIEDTDVYTLVGMMEYLEEQAGHLAISMSPSIPGLMLATKTTDAISMAGSKIDEQTGIIKLIYNLT